MSPTYNTSKTLCLTEEKSPAETSVDTIILDMLRDDYVPITTINATKVEDSSELQCLRNCPFGGNGYLTVNPYQLGLHPNSAAPTAAGNTQARPENTAYCSTVDAVSIQPSVATGFPHCPPAFPVLQQQLSLPVEMEDVFATLNNDPLFAEQFHNNLLTPAVNENATYVPQITASCSLNNELHDEVDVLSNEAGNVCQYKTHWNQPKELKDCTADMDTNQTKIAEDSNANGKSGKCKVKDKKYWDRRQKNNLAAKRSRAAKRIRDLMIEHRVAQLRKDNIALRAELLSMKEENTRLKGRLYNGNAGHVLI